jgi:protease PrsW
VDLQSFDFTGSLCSYTFEAMLSLLLAIAPGAAICLFIYSRDRWEKEPLITLVVSFLLGMISTMLPLLIQVLSGNITIRPGKHLFLSYAIFAYLIVAFSEEGSKFVVLRFYAYPKKIFNDPFAGILYSVMIGMGFATLENIEYVLHYGIRTGFVRFFLSVPAHGAFAVLMGYYVGLARISHSRSVWLLWKGLLIAVFFHGSFDLCIFLQENKEVTRYISTGLLSFGAFASFYTAIRLAMRSIRMNRVGFNKDLLG